MNSIERARLAFGTEQVDRRISSLRRVLDPKGPFSLSEKERARVATELQTFVTARNLLLGPLNFEPRRGDAKKIDVMTTDHRRWSTFTKRLGGPDGCNFRKDDRGKTVWTCRHNYRFAKKILRSMGIDLLASIAFFRQHGGSCDCKILFNVDLRDREPTKRSTKKGRQTVTRTDAF